MNTQILRATVFFLAVVSAVVQPAFAETIYLVTADEVIPYELEERAGWEKAAPDKQLAADGITFNITYEDAAGQGFRSNADGANRRNRLEEVLAYVADTINIDPNLNRELDVTVKASLNTGGQNFLAQAGTFFSGEAAFQQGSTLTRLLSGDKPFINFEEIQITVDFGHSWNTGTGQPGQTQSDLFTILLHEVTHGLGLVSLAGANGLSTTPGGAFTAWDQLIARNSDDAPVFAGSPPALNVPLNALTSNDLVFLGVQANALFPSATQPPIHSPAPFAPGSSMSHWDRQKIGAGVVMTQSFFTGVAIRTYAPVDIGALRDIGYPNAAETPLASCALASVDILTPAGNIQIPHDQTSANVNLTSQIVFAAASVCMQGMVEVAYTVDGTPRGASQNRAGNFPITVPNLGVGAHTVLAVATNLDTSETVQDTFNFSITQAAQPTPITSVDPNPAAGINYGTVVVGGAGAQDFIVTNTGTGTLTGSATSNSAIFVVVAPADYSLAANQSSAPIRVRFVPAAAGAANGIITFSGGTNGPIQIAVSGTGMAAKGCPACGPGSLDRSSWGGDLCVIGLAAALLIAASRRRVSQVSR